MFFLSQYNPNIFWVVIVKGIETAAAVYFFVPSKRGELKKVIYIISRIHII